jgi:hypothetical protein
MTRANHNIPAFEKSPIESAPLLAGKEGALSSPFPIFPSAWQTAPRQMRHNRTEAALLISSIGTRRRF